MIWKNRLKPDQGALNALKNKRQTTFGTGDPIQEKRETEKKIQTEKEAVEAIRQQIQQVQICSDGKTAVETDCRKKLSGHSKSM